MAVNGQPPAKSRVKILLVDDENTVRDVYRKVLQHAGFQVVEAIDYEGVVRRLDGSISLALVDVVLAGESGMEVLSYIRKRQPLCPVIMISGYATKDNAIDALHKGAANYLEKPISLYELVHVVKRQLSYRTLQEENIHLLKEQKLQQKLRKSEMRYRHLIEAIPDGVLIASEHRIVYASAVAADLLKATGPADLVGRELLDLIGSECREPVAEHMTHALRKQVSPPRLDNQMMRLNGEVFDAEFTITSTDYLGKPAIQMVFHDITERKRSEEALRESEQRAVVELATKEMALFPEMNPAPVLRVDREGAVCVANHAARQCCKNRKVIGASVFSLCPGLKQADFETLFDADGKTLQVETQFGEASHLITLRGDIEHGHAYIYGANITLLKQLEAQIRQSQKMEAVGLLAGGIAHDFNSLLGVILGYGDMMRDDIPEGSHVRRNLEEIITAGKRSRDMVRRLMDFGRPSEEKPVPVHFAPLVETEVGLLRSSLPATIRIDLDIREASARVLANASQIRQVIINLGLNAGNAIADHHGVVKIGLTETMVDAELASAHEADPGAYLRLTVSDNGHGMDEETMEHIFEPFYTTKSTSESTGLGLAIVHSNVKRHGGFVTVESKPGKGSSFHVYLPEMEDEE